MSLFGNPSAPHQVAEAADVAGQAHQAHLMARLAGAEDTIDMLKEELLESLGDVEQLQAEDRGWLSLTAWGAEQFSRAGLQTAANIGRVMIVVNPLIRRGGMLRVAYVWGQGVQVSAADPDVNAVVQGFLDAESTKCALSSAQAREEIERVLQTDGNLTLALFTDRVTGEVTPRSFCFDEMQDVICNPDDRKEPWFYLRQWSTRGQAPGVFGRTLLVNQTQRAYYPALGYLPARRPKAINGVQVEWDVPVLHVKVNALDGWDWGVGDVYAALPWARAYKDSLTDWARLVKALSKFAWRLSADKSSKAQKAAAAIGAVTNYDPTTGQDQSGATWWNGPGANLEAIPKTGATIDSGSFKPLAGMVAAAMGVPVTMLLADPGITGARSVADTLDTPTEFEMNLRRELHTSILQRVCGYVVEQAVRAPRGELHGTVTRVGPGRQQVQLAGDVESTITVDWPDLTGVSQDLLVGAIVKADATGKLPGDVTMRLLLQALQVDDVDELVDKHTDADGNWIDPGVTAGQVAVDAFNRGQDPAAAVA